MCATARERRRASVATDMVPNEHRPQYSIGQVAGMLGTRHRFLHRLDRFDVVRPRRTPGGHRRYSTSEVDRIRYVIELAGEGMTLVAIRRILTLERRIRELEAQCEAAWDRVVTLETRRAISNRRRAPVPPL